MTHVPVIPATAPPASLTARLKSMGLNINCAFAAITLVV
jgi:hypothetical protein